MDALNNEQYLRDFLLEEYPGLRFESLSEERKLKIKQLVGFFRYVLDREIERIKLTIN